MDEFHCPDIPVRNRACGTAWPSSRISRIHHLYWICKNFLFNHPLHPHVLKSLMQAMAGWAGYGSYFAAPAVQWRLVLALQAVAPLILLIGSPRLPESPRWLIYRGHDAEGPFPRVLSNELNHS